jgi:hypothetical protein
MKIFFVLAAVLFCMASAVYAEGVKKEIRFPRGKSSTTIEESVLLSERDVYFLTANAKQTLEIKISSVEDNAVFEVYTPGSTVAEKDGLTEVNGETLPGAGDTEEIRSWKGVLPVSGKYVIVVGGTRGNATYKLHVAVR